MLYISHYGELTYEKFTKAGDVLTESPVLMLSETEISEDLEMIIKAWSDLSDVGKVRIMAILLEELNGNVG